MSAMAFLAASQGPSGFSFASMTTAPAGTGLRSAAARDGSVAMRKATAAVAAADNWRNDLREAFAGAFELTHANLPNRENGFTIARI